MPITTPSKEHGAAAIGDEGKRFEEKFTFLSLRPPVGVVAFSSHAKMIGEGSLNHSPHANFPFLHFKWRSARAPVPLIGPR